MTESLLQIRDRLMANLPREVAYAEPHQMHATLGHVTESITLPVRAESMAFAVEDETTGKVVLTVPLEINRELAEGPSAGLVADDFLLRLSGRLVEAEKANQNGAFWAAEDLEFGMPSIQFGPLNWLHEERRVVGVLTDAVMVNREAADASGLNPHVRSNAVLWKWLAAKESAAVEHFADQRQAYYSMECISRQIACVGDNGCGHVMDYLDAQNKTDKACEHVKEHTASRRFVSPIFQGAAIIVPPTKPGWAHADLAVERQAAHAVEKAELTLPGLDQKQAEAMVQQVLAWAQSA